VFDGDALTGHNTDGNGLIAALEERLGAPITGKTIVVLGAGGAVRGVLPALISRCAGSIVIANRSVSSAEGLVSRFGGGAALSSAPLTGLAEVIKTADVLINATALSITSATFLDIDLTALKKGALIFDMNYGRAPASVGDVFARHSLGYSDGLTMRLFQGALSFTLWTKKDAPLSVMRSALGL